MKKLKTLNYELFGINYAVVFSQSRYCQNDTPSLMMMLVEDGEVTEPFGHVSVNLGNIPESWFVPGKIPVFLDTNNTPGLVEFIEKNHLGTDTGYARQSGFCTYPLYLLDEKALEPYRLTE